MHIDGQDNSKLTCCVEALGKGIWVEFTNVVLVTFRICVEQKFNLVGAEIIRCGANIVNADFVAVLDLVVAVAFAIQGIVHFMLMLLAERRVVVGVTWRDSEIIVGLVLNQRVKPSVADRHRLERHFMSAINVFSILSFKVSGMCELLRGHMYFKEARLISSMLWEDLLCEDWPIMASVALRCKMKAIPRILSRIQSLQRLHTTYN